MSPYEELLEKDGSISVQSQKHTQSCYRDASDKVWVVSWNCNWGVEGNTASEFQKNIDCRIPSVNTVFMGAPHIKCQKNGKLLL